MRVLITNRYLGFRSGSENYVRDVAVGLLARGHEPAVFSPDSGTLADELRAGGVEVVQRLGDLRRAPELIHGHHHPLLMAALRHFSRVPALFVAHAYDAWTDEPPCFPRIHRFVAVDQPTWDRIAAAGVPPGRLHLVLNAVDLSQFLPRPPLPGRPQRALVFSNYATERTYLPAVRQACERAGLSLDVVGRGVGHVVACPERILGSYDLVFAKSKCALEAVAVGAAVVLCDAWGAGPMVTERDFDHLRRFNFGRTLLTGPVRPETLLAEIQRYDPEDVRRVSARARAEAGLDGMLDQLLFVYARALEDHHQTRPAPGKERWAMTRYLLRWPLRGWLPTLPTFESARQRQPVAKLERLARAVSPMRAAALVLRTAKRVVAVLSGRAPAARVFTRIWKHGLWASAQSRSGPGSTLERTAVVRRELPALLRRLEVRTLLDAACGDFHWISCVDLSGISYSGVDIVPGLIASSERLYGGPGRTFGCADVRSDPLPRADAILCRDTLIHLPNSDVSKALANFRSSGAVWLLVTHHPGIAENRDAPTGGFRPLNLERPPFGLPPPRDVLVENPASGKTLAVWALADLPANDANMSSERPR